MFCEMEAHLMVQSAAFPVLTDFPNIHVAGRLSCVGAPTDPLGGAPR